MAADYGISSIIQPGGSIRDEDSIKACNELGIKMILTGKRHFLHWDKLKELDFLNILFLTLNLYLIMILLDNKLFY